MAFCTNCGKQLADGAKFCFECGSEVNTPATTQSEKRTVIYDGEIHKCPNCGDILDAYEMICETCGWERRGVGATKTLKEFEEKFLSIKSVEAKCDLIRTFAIPNNREDILEFMILASTNIENNAYQEVGDAWSVKFEQAYEKSKILFGETEEFKRCFELYLQKKEAHQKTVRRNEQEEKKLRQKEETAKTINRTAKFFVRNMGWILAVVGILSGVAMFVGLGVVPHIVKENQLEQLVAEVEQYIEMGDFEAARRKANLIIDDSDWSKESKEKWENIRESLLEAIAREEILAGVKICVGISHENMQGHNFQDIVEHLKQQGFTNVKTEKIPDLITGWLTKDGEVEKVTINGSTDFDAKSVFEPDAEIVVYYHTFK